MAKNSLKPATPAPAEILDNYRAAATSRPGDPEPQIDLGWGLYGAGQFAEAVQQFDQVVEQNPNAVDALYGLGLSHKALGHKEAAVTTFDKVAGLADVLEDKVRGSMLRRLAHGHINEMNSGDWNLEKEIWQRQS
jgi:tetratricopeptide (TPR) repeat protein